MAVGWVKSILNSEPARVEPPQPTTATVRSSRPSCNFSSSQRNALAGVGQHVRRLRIETPALDKCSPRELFLILQHCPTLDLFSDYCSARWPMQDPYFMPLEEFGSLLRPETFPSLLAVRDMSWESDAVRRTGRLRLLVVHISICQGMKRPSTRVWTRRRRVRVRLSERGS